MPYIYAAMKMGEADGHAAHQRGPQRLQQKRLVANALTYSRPAEGVSSQIIDAIFEWVPETIADLLSGAL